MCALHVYDITDNPNTQTAMKPADLSNHLESAFEQAHQLLKANDGFSATFLRVPNVTVSIGFSVMIYNLLHSVNQMFGFQIFFDELNASTCGGLFKEIIIDRTFEGKVTCI